MAGNSEWLVGVTCPTCHARVHENRLRRPDGTFMDPTVYCETCDELVAFLTVDGAWTGEKLKDF